MSTKRVFPCLGKNDVFVVPTLDGSHSLYSVATRSSYHSMHGAVSESKHVFIQHGLTTQSYKEQIKILEFGFGTGLNAFLSFLFSRNNATQVSYTGLDSYDIDPLIIRELNYPAYLAAVHFADIFDLMHVRDDFSIDKFTFRRLKYLNELLTEEMVDCIFFDAFSPQVHPEQWEQNIFDALFEISTDGACLVTYCAKGEIRRRIQKAGYHVNRIAGAPGKREMIQAFKK